VGIAIITILTQSKLSLKSSLSFMKTPLLGAVVVSLLLRRVAMPELVMTILDYAAKMTVPLAMISIGLCLQARSVTRQPAALGIALFMKLMFLPCLMYIALPVFGVTGVVANVGVLLGATPSAVFSGILAERFGADDQFAASAIFASTLLGAVVAPLVLLAL
jgi:predicted permease